MLDQQKRDYYLSKLFELLRIPSISTLAKHKQDVLDAALWIKEYLERVGFDSNEVELLYADALDMEGHHPVLFAQRISDPQKPTVLLYAHYDVQPVDPVEDWDSEPFEPDIREGKIYARGANDNKGQLMTQLAALEELSTEWGSDGWPINVKILFEGEEEAGGENIEAVIAQFAKTDKFKADVCLVSDTPWLAKDKPTILTGLRGIVYAQIDVKLADGELHSGEFGGAVRNPANAIAYIISKLRDEETGKVLIPGFYDSVLEVSEAEKQDINQNVESEAEFIRNGKNLRGVFGETGYSRGEHKTIRPTLDVNGIWGGFQGEGAKTIIPATAHAKVSMRLVPNQKPAEIADLFANYVRKIAPTGVEVKVDIIHAGNWVGVDADNRYIKLAAQAMEETFGKAPVFFKEGGSIPAIAEIQNQLGVVPVLMGYGLPDDSLHSPNEKFDLDQFYGGIECNVRLLKDLSSAERV